MDWTEITVSINKVDLEKASAICNMASSGGVYIEDYSDLEQGAQEIAHVDLIDEELLCKDRDSCLIHIYVSPETEEETIQYINKCLANAEINHEIILNGVRDSDWEDSWKKYFKVTPIGDKLIICPEWENYENKENKAVLRIDPGAAFGTGTHATTSLCLELLQEYVKADTKVLDIGSGSGILSIAAVLLGASKADGVDIDAVAVKVAKENALLNNVQERTNYICGDLDEQIVEKYDVICANIVADIIMRLNKNIKNYMTDGAVYITSGIIDVRVDEVRESFREHCLEIIKEVKKDNWYAFVLGCRK